MSLRLPSRPPKLIYLDLNHWIALSKAWAGRSDGLAFRPTLDAALDAVSRGRALFPLADAIYMEVAKIGPYRQRADLTAVAEAVSGFVVITPSSLVIRLEIEDMLDRLVGPGSPPAVDLSYVDWGVARAFGKVGGFRFLHEDTGADVTDEARALYPDGPLAFERRMGEAEFDLNRASLRGPTLEEETDLRTRGWNPRAAVPVAEQWAEGERQQAARLTDAPQWRRGRLRDVVTTREIANEWNSPLFEALTRRGTTFDAVFADRAETRRAFDSMPTFDVTASVMTQYHRDPNHRWTPNDMFDLGALRVTVPYCDVVATDKQAARAIQSSGVGHRYSSVVIARTSDLEELIA